MTDTFEKSYDTPEYKVPTYVPQCRSPQDLNTECSSVDYSANIYSTIGSKVQPDGPYNHPLFTISMEIPKSTTDFTDHQKYISDFTECSKVDSNPQRADDEIISSMNIPKYMSGTLQPSQSSPTSQNIAVLKDEPLNTLDIPKYFLESLDVPKFSPTDQIAEPKLESPLHYESFLLGQQDTQLYNFIHQDPQTAHQYSVPSTSQEPPLPLNSSSGE